MNEDHVSLPPYPSDGDTAQTLYTRLIEFGEWLDGCRQSVEDENNVQLAALPEVKSKAVYCQQPVLELYHQLRLLQTFREQWDALLRDFEGGWDCPARVQQMTCIVVAAAEFFEYAFLPHETREHKRKCWLRDMRKQQKQQLKDYLNDDDEEEEDDDFEL